MDWGSIIISGLAGALGAFAGVVAGFVLTPILSLFGDSLKGLLRSLMVLGGILAGLVFLPTYLSPHAEPYIAEWLQESGETDLIPIEVVEQPVEVPDAVISEAIEKEIADLGDPFFEAVLAREPSRAQSVKTRLVAAYKQGGQERLVSELIQADQEIIKTAFPYYLARAQEDDLIAAAEGISGIIKILGAEDAETCHLWLYGGLVGRSFDYDRYIAAVGEEEHFALQQKLANAVLGADDFLPEYDEEAAFRSLTEISQTLTEELGPEKIGLVTAGQEPGTPEDTRIACDASARFYDLILAQENAADVLRYRFVSGGI